MNTTTTTKVSKAHPAIRAILKATFPQYKGRTIKVVSGPSTVTGYPADGGTYRKARILNLRTMGVVYVHDDSFDLATSDDHVIVTHAFHCGHDCGITIYVGVGLSQDEVSALVDVLLKSNGFDEEGHPKLTRVVAAMCHEMFANSLRPDLAVWGSYDKGHERVTALDLTWVVVQETAAGLRDGERRAANNASMISA
jgi:hypothetical protein